MVFKSSGIYLMTFFFISFSIASTLVIGLQSIYPSPYSQRPHGLIFSGDPLDLTLNLDLNFNPSDQPSPHPHHSRILASAPILGFYNQSNGPLADWMANVPDQTSLVHLNIPGTHDSATWNYTTPVQESMINLTGVLPPAIAYQCQNQSLFQMLGDGIRFLDLRIGFLPGHQQLGFYHASALLSSTVTLPDVLLGFYRWLDDHPTETVFISIKVDNATFADPPSDQQPSGSKLQTILEDLLTDELGSQYWYQTNATLPTLADARGKLIFVQRTQFENPSIGIALPPSEFHDNDPSFSIVYNPSTGASAFIEDFYNLVPNPSSFANKVKLKLDATFQNLRLAIGDSHPNQLFISFASGGALRNLPPVTPQMLAIGVNGTAGVNEGLSGFVSQHQGQRFGVVLLDWYDSTPGLVEKIIYRSN